MRPTHLFDEARLLSKAVRDWSETLHEGVGLTAVMREVLELVLLGEASTVPAMARARSVSRQQMQQQVNALLGRDLVERRDNPAHKRSSLIGLTDKGRALVENMRADEFNAMRRMQVGVSDNAVLEAAQVLAAWRTALQRDLETS